MPWDPAKANAAPRCKRCRSPAKRGGEYCYWHDPEGRLTCDAIRHGKEVRGMGLRCRIAPMRGRRRCRLHGGYSRGTPIPGNMHNLQHGEYSTAAKLERARLAEELRAKQAEQIDQIERELAKKLKARRRV
jgi:hypothetical protein